MQAPASIAKPTIASTRVIAIVILLSRFELAFPKEDKREKSYQSYNRFHLLLLGFIEFFVDVTVRAANRKVSSYEPDQYETPKKQSDQSVHLTSSEV